MVIFHILMRIWTLHNELIVSLVWKDQLRISLIAWSYIQYASLCWSWYDWKGRSKYRNWAVVHFECDIDLFNCSLNCLIRSLYCIVVTKRAEPQGKALDLPVDLRSYPHLWSRGLMTEKTRSRVQAAEISFIRRVAGVSLSGIGWEAQLSGRNSD